MVRNRVITDIGHDLSGRPPHGRVIDACDRLVLPGLPGYVQTVLGGLAPQPHRQGPLRWHAPGSGPAGLGAGTTSRSKPPVRAGPPSGPTQQSD